MARLLSQGLQREIERQETAENLLAFLDISHPQIIDPIRVVCDPKDFSYEGNLYTGFLFEITILSDRESPPEAQLKIQNADQIIGDTIRRLQTPPRLRIDLVPLSDFDLTVDPRTPISTPELVYRADKLFLLDVSVDSLEISGRIQGWDYRLEKWPSRAATQQRCPGLFR